MSTETETVCENQLSDGTDEVRAIVERTKSVYSLPAVAVEVIQLTSNPTVDSLALKECIENDPALTAKLLRVVNSSLFGLSCEVSDLNQALALLGVKPLKLLVLGFSLPEELFARAAREQLQWYWKRSLVRAVTAREISQRYWQQSGDDAFLAGLLEDIGVLVLLDQLREPYARFLSQVIEGNSELSGLEREALGFDHRTLTSALLRNWKLPSRLIDAIAEERSIDALIGKNKEAKELAKILHLASLMARLIGQNSLQVLPELLAAGRAYCKLDREELHLILPELQEKVAQLADVLSLDLEDEVSYLDIVKEAHQQMAQLCEEISGETIRSDNLNEGRTAAVSAESVELRAALSELVRRPVAREASVGAEVAVISSTKPANPLPVSSRTPLREAVGRSNRPLTMAVGVCRSRRVPLSLLLVSCDEQVGTDLAGQDRLRQIVEDACHLAEWDQAKIERTCQDRWQIILPNCERHQAVRLAQEVFQSVHEQLERGGDSTAGLLCSLSAGVASVTLPPKNFNPRDLVDAAQRCLYAAESSDANVVKSIEIL